MASPARVSKTISLEEFLRLPEIDEHPYLEYIDGRIEAKVSPQKKHGRIEKRSWSHLDAYSEPRDWARLSGVALHVRWPFDGSRRRLLTRRAHRNRRQRTRFSTRPSDRRTSMSRSSRPTRRSGNAARNWLFSTANGCPLGWLIDPGAKRRWTSTGPVASRAAARRWRTGRQIRCCPGIACRSPSCSVG